MPHRKLAIFYGLMLALAVLSCGAVVGTYYTVKAKKYYEQHQFHFTGGPLFAPDPEIGYVERPGLRYRKTDFPSYDVFTDARGVRVSRPELPAPERIDLLNVGCSFTWGDGVQYEQTYPHLAGNLTGLKEYNVALPGYGTTAALLS